MAFSLWNVNENIPTDKLIVLYHLQAGKEHGGIGFDFYLDKYRYGFAFYFISGMGLAEGEPGS